MRRLQNGNAYLIEICSAKVCAHIFDGVHSTHIQISDVGKTGREIRACSNNAEISVYNVFIMIFVSYIK